MAVFLTAAFGLRGAGTTSPTSNHRFHLYDPASHLLAETARTTAAAPPWLYEYIWFNGQPVAQEVAGGIRYYITTDHLGTPFLLTNSSKATVWWAEYEPYGRVFGLHGGDQHQPLRLPGQEAEQWPDLGMNGASERSYNIFRWYRPSWGRYSQPDPVGLQGGNVHGLNLLYSYVTLNPLALTDPLGLEVKTVGCDPSANRRIQAAAGDADAASATCLTCPDDSGPFRQKIRNLTVYCVGSEVSRGLPICGRAGSQNPHGGWTWWKRSIALTPEGISGGGGCNCLKALILHETLHLLKYQDSGEKDPFTEERRCFRSCFQPVAASVTVR